MSFFEIQFPTNISIGAHGGPEFATDIAMVNSGFESRNSRWITPLAKYDVSHAIRTLAELSQLISFFRMVQGKANGFRFKDFVDYKVASTEGYFAKNISGIGVTPSQVLSGEKVYQLYKAYSFSSNFSYRKITKPAVAVPISVFVNNVINTDYTYDNNTGLLTWNSTAGTDTVISSLQSSTFTGITCGSSTIIIATNTFNVGDRVYFENISGTTQLNGLYGTITAGSSSQFTVNINSSTFSAWTSGGDAVREPVTREVQATINWASTSGYTVGQTTYFKETSYGGTWNSVTAAKSYTVLSVNGNSTLINANTVGYPSLNGQTATFTKYFNSTDTVKWSGEFDVPCRFDTDYMNTSVDSGIHGAWNSIPIVEIRI